MAAPHPLVQLVMPARDLVDVTPRTRLLTLDAAGADFTFHAGQAVWLRTEGAQGRKPYSIASAPVDLSRHGALEFLVTLDERGSPGPHLEGLAPGIGVEIEGPLGGFDLPRSVHLAPVLLIGGGTGIAPLRSMWRQLLEHATAPTISVVYSARSPRDLAFLSELVELERQRRIRLSVTITGQEAATWSGMRGRLTADVLVRDLQEARADTRCAICGPAPFVAHAQALLLSAGVPDVHIATERW